MSHRTAHQLDAGLDDIRASPRATGSIALITRRPAVGEREVLELAQLDMIAGLVGDTWVSRPNPKTPDGLAHPDKQLTVMNVRVIRLIADPNDWALAGDQLYVDFDLSSEHVPPGTRLAAGTAILEASIQPHRGCAKFSERFGSDAMRWVNSETGRALNLRGINARVIAPGTIRRGDSIRRL